MLLDDKNEFQTWWTEKWRERENILAQAFGETEPPGTVTSFSWNDFETMIPGACALTFPPGRPSRPEWLTVTHGLAQPKSPSSSLVSDQPSGYGYEFGFLTVEYAAWTTPALRDLMTYLAQSGKPIDRGHRVPMWFRNVDSQIVPVLGKLPPSDRESSASRMRAVLFWPYMKFPRGFDTSTGYFSVLIGTTITEKEWEMAKSTSSAHLLLLLFKTGIGQRSYLDRASIESDRTWQEEWTTISSYAQQEAEELLFEVAKMP